MEKPLSPLSPWSTCPSPSRRARSSALSALAALAARARRAAPAATAVLAAAWLGAAPARADTADLTDQVRAWAQSLGATLPTLPDARVDVEIGQLNPRLRLAPCEQVEPYVPLGSKPWGRTRIGLRCVRGPSPWNVYLPVTVRLWAPAPVLRAARPSGHVLQADDFELAEVDWAAHQDQPLTRTEQVVGRALARPLAAGEPVRAHQIQRRQWFAPGDMVQVVATGAGFSVSAEAQALTRGLEGEPARVRMRSGRVLTGTPVAARRLEIAL